MYEPILDPLKKAMERRGLVVGRKAQDDPPTAEFRVELHGGKLCGVVLLEHAQRRIIVQIVVCGGYARHSQLSDCDLVGVRLEHDLPAFESVMRFEGAIDLIADRVVAMLREHELNHKAIPDRASEDARWVPTEDCCRDE